MAYLKRQNMKLDNICRSLFQFLSVMSSTSLLPAIYFIKAGYNLWNIKCGFLNEAFDIITYLAIPVIISWLSLCWMKIQAKDSINQEVNTVTSVNHEYLPVYLGYIFVSLSIPNPNSGSVDWLTLSIIYFLICLFITCSKTLCFNPLFVIFGYGFYQIKTRNSITVFVLTKRKIRKGEENITFPHLRKVNEMFYIDSN